jgi:hypothetical protein
MRVHAFDTQCTASDCVLPAYRTKSNFILSSWLFQRHLLWTIRRVTLLSNFCLYFIPVEPFQIASCEERFDTFFYFSIKRLISLFRFISFQLNMSSFFIDDRRVADITVVVLVRIYSMSLSFRRRKENEIGKRESWIRNDIIKRVDTSPPKARRNVRLLWISVKLRKGISQTLLPYGCSSSVKWLDSSTAQRGRNPTYPVTETRVCTCNL